MTLGLVQRSPLKAMIRSPLGVLGHLSEQFAFNIMRMIGASGASPPSGLTPNRALIAFDLSEDEGETIVTGSVDIGAPLATKAKATITDLKTEYVRLINYSAHIAPSANSNLADYRADLFYLSYTRNSAGQITIQEGNALQTAAYLVIPSADIPAHLSISGSHLILHPAFYRTTYGNYAVFVVPNTADVVGQFVSVPKTELPAYWNLVTTPDPVIVVDNKEAGAFVTNHVGIDNAVFTVNAPTNPSFGNTTIISGDYRAKLFWTGTSVEIEGTTYFTGTYTVSYELASTVGIEARLAVNPVFTDARALFETDVSLVTADNLFIGFEAVFGLYAIYASGDGLKTADTIIAQSDATTDYGDHTFRSVITTIQNAASPSLVTKQFSLSAGALILGSTLPESVISKLVYHAITYGVSSSAWGLHEYTSYEFTETIWNDALAHFAIARGSLVEVANSVRTGVYSVERDKPDYNGSVTITYTPSENYEPPWNTVFEVDIPPANITALALFPASVGKFYVYKGVTDYIGLNTTIINTRTTPISSSPETSSYQAWLGGGRKAHTFARTGGSPGPSWPVDQVQNYTNSAYTDYSQHWALSALLGGSAADSPLDAVTGLSSLPIPFFSTNERAISILAPNLLTGQDGVCMVTCSNITNFLAAYEARNKDSAAPSDLSSYYTILLNNFAPRSLIELCLAAGPRSFVVFKPAIAVPAAPVNLAPPVILSAADDTGTEGETYSRSLSISSGALPVIWTLDSAPAGATIDTTGKVELDPIVSLPITWVARATNAAGTTTESWTTNLAIAVVPVLFSSGDESVGTSPHNKFVVANQGENISWSFDAAPPAGMIFTAEETNYCIVHWETPVPGVYTITVRGTNTAGSDTETWELTVT